MFRHNLVLTSIASVLKARSVVISVSDAYHVTAVNLCR
uniref:Uncharacterized protein n=1 Tax=Arundo donax TaxID=35708 RepID=A0A0A9EKN2_ARUDO